MIKLVVMARRRFWFLIVFIFSFLSAMSQKMTRAEYIDTYKDWAIKEMQRTGIPASITLAQGILESGDGNSTLARKGNNHFGIKCHSDWKGKRIYHDDDKKNECFRKYKSAYDSYKDHSDFLTTKQRYQFLFDYKTTDYTAWAKGLKKAGYATSRTYDKALIKLIEENELYRFDDASFVAKKSNKDKPEKEKMIPAATPNPDVLLNNNIKYVVAKPGDNLDAIAQQYGKLAFELARYNETEQDSELKPGQVVYLQPKRRKAAAGNDFHIVKEGDTMYSISQQYGVKLKFLYTKNLMQEGDIIKAGQKIWLRKKKKGIPTLDLQLAEPQEEDVQIEVEFDG